MSTKFLKFFHVVTVIRYLSRSTYSYAFHYVVVSGHLGSYIWWRTTRSEGRGRKHA